MDKNVRNLLIFGIIFTSLLVIQKIHFYGFQDIELVEIEGEYIDPRTNQTQYQYHTFKIVKPLNPKSEKLPVCILLHGGSGSSDNIDSVSLNPLKLELVRNQFMVVLPDIDFIAEDYFKLNDIVDYLLKRSDVEKSQIGIMGHSHGASFAFNFALIRNNTINAVVCGNFPSFYHFYRDYFTYYLKYIDWSTGFYEDELALYFSDRETYEDLIPDNLKNFTLPTSENNPRNLLLLTNILDYAPEPPFEDYLKDFTDNRYKEKNHLYGDFEDGTARELYVSFTVFGHTSLVYSPDSIYHSISWLNQAFNVKSPLSIQLISFRIYFEFVIIGLLIASGVAIILTVCNFLPHQEEFLNKIKNKRYEKKYKAQKQNPHDKEEKTEIKENKTNYSDISEMDINKNLLKKEIIKYLVISEVIIIGLYLLYSNLLFQYIWNIPVLSNIVNDFLGNSFSLFFFSYIGFYISYVLISNFFPFSFMIFWVLVILLIRNSNVFKQSDLKGLSSYKGKDYIKSAIIGAEIFILFWIISQLIIYDLTGIYPILIYFPNIIFAIFILFFINQIYFELFHEEFEKKASKNYFKLVGTNMLLYIFFYLPGAIYFDYYDLIVLPALISLAFLNPLLYQKKFDILTVTMFNYFFILLITFII